MKMPINIAFGSVPKDGGTFTFYNTIRTRLLDYNIKIYCVSIGSQEAQLWENKFADEGCFKLAEKTFKVKTQAKIFSAWCAENGIDIVLGINSVAILSSLPHLSERIRVMSRCANSFDHGYKITISGYDRLAGIVAQTPRQVHDLTKSYGADREKLRLIPNGIDIEKYKGASSIERGKSRELRIGYLGRLEHNQKGVLFIPDIVKIVDSKNISFQLKIAGKGVHEDFLSEKLGKYVKSGQVRFTGALSPREIPEFLSNIDVLLFTSQFEGCPNALLEAMAAGCVPVATQLDGITDFILEDGETGFLCPLGDCQTFAERIYRLNDNRKKLQNMSFRVAQAAQARFSQARMASDYAKYFHKIMAAPPPAWTPRPWSEFQVDPAFPQTWRRFIPGPIKKRARKIMYNFGFSNRSA